MEPRRSAPTRRGNLVCCAADAEDAEDRLRRGRRRARAPGRLGRLRLRPRPARPLRPRARRARASELRDVQDPRAASRCGRARCSRPTRQGEHFLWLNWHFSRLRPRACTTPAARNYIPMNFGEAPDYYRRFIDPIDVVCIKTCADGRARLLQLRRRRHLPQGADRAREGPDRRDLDRACRTSTAREEAVHASEVDYVIEGGDEPLAGAGEPGADRRRPQGRRADRRRDRGRRLPPDRHRRHAERRLRRC